VKGWDRADAYPWPGWRRWVILASEVPAVRSATLTSYQGGDPTMDKPLISVIVIFFNAEQFIEEAIESILAQTYDAWELLLVDDGSTDRTRTLALRYVERHPEKSRVLEHEGHQNRGMSASRNLGITHAKGQYIAFLDADDVWLPGKLEHQVALLESHPAVGMVYGPTQWWYSWSGATDGQRDFVYPPNAPPARLFPPPTLLLEFLRSEGLSPCTCSILVRRKVLERTGGFEERFRGLYEDQAFCAKVALETPVLASSNCSCRYRQHPASASEIARTGGSDHTPRLAFLNWLASYLVGRGVDDPEVWRTVKRERWRCRHATLNHALGRARQVARRITPRPRQWVWAFARLPFVRRFRSMQLRRLRPLGSGRQVGTPVVRYYWARFLEHHRSEIRGAALEVGTTVTVREYGGHSITRADALDLAGHSPDVSVVADLSRADHVPADQYDCFINQFTMHLIYDLDAALYHSIRMLKPGGVLLVNFPCVDYYFPRGLDMGTGAPMFVYWWFTPIQVENLLRRAGLGPTDYTVETFGNLFSRIAYQMNLPAEELARHELEHVDPGHPLLICVRAVKPTGWQAPRPEYREPWYPRVTPAEWNPETGHYVS
jgi:glycosyltransferase involved in cell wall biosynthesis